MRKQILLFTALLAVFAVLISAGCVTTDSPGDSEGMVTITDAFGRDVTIPENPEKNRCCRLRLDAILCLSRN